jgi:hypothetical protein
LVAGFAETHMISELHWMKSFAAMPEPSTTLTVVAELVMSALKVVVAVVGTVYAGLDCLTIALPEVPAAAEVPSWARTTVSWVVEATAVTNICSEPSKT